MIKGNRVEGIGEIDGSDLQLGMLEETEISGM